MENKDQQAIDRLNKRFPPETLVIGSDRYISESREDIGKFLLEERARAREEYLEEIGKLGNASEYISAYGLMEDENPWVKITEVKLKIEAIKDSLTKSK